MKSIYLDHNAATPLDPEVLAAMMPYFSDVFANPASEHRMGWQAAAAVEAARARIAKGIGAATRESIIFTSGTTESSNLAIKGVIEAARENAPKLRQRAIAGTSQEDMGAGCGFSAAGSPHIISQVTEHPCVLESLHELARQGHEVTWLGVDNSGRVDPAQLAKALRPDTALVSVMHANNEIGTIQNIAELARVTHRHGALFHTDAAQTVGKIPVDVTRLGVDLMSFSAHKIYGPKGIGALYIAPRTPRIRIQPLIHGGGHELGLRSGTLNVAAIVGFATALDVAMRRMAEDGPRIAALRYDFVRRVTEDLGEVCINHPLDNVLPNTANLCLTRVNAEELITALPQLAFSTGAACAAKSTQPSHVLTAIGLSDAQAKSSIRISLGRGNTAEEIASAVQAIVTAATASRAKLT